MAKWTMLKLFICLILLFNGTNVFAAEESLRRCLLLPINDDVENSIGFKVYEEVEDYLQKVNWCVYKSNSEIIDILKNYQQNLTQHLQNPEVLKTIAEKTEAGSLIRIFLHAQQTGINLHVEVLNSNGEDILYDEKEFVDEMNIDKIVQTIRIHLGKYRRTIPYQARVISVLGKQITFDSGKFAGMKIGDNFVIKREKKKIRHPLLKKIVSYETEVIVKGEVVSLTEFQSVGIVNDMEAVRKIKKNDWVVLEQEKGEETVPQEYQFPKIQGHEFGKLGVLGINIIAGHGENETLHRGRRSTIGGYIYGLGGTLEMWATRNYWIKGEVEKVIGTYKTQNKKKTPVMSGSGVKKAGGKYVQTGIPVEVHEPSSPVVTSLYKIYAGYRYLPMGFFYGPQIDGYLGYAYESYEMDTAATEGFGSASFYGFLFGVQGSIPFYQQWRAFLRADLILRPGYQEDIKIHGSKASSHNYMLEGGGTYEYDSKTSFLLSLTRNTNMAKFQNPIGENRFEETKLKLGVLFTF